MYEEYNELCPVMTKVFERVLGNVTNITNKITAYTIVTKYNENYYLPSPKPNLPYLNNLNSYSLFYFTFLFLSIILEIEHKDNITITTIDITAALIDTVLGDPTALIQLLDNGAVRTLRFHDDENILRKLTGYDVIEDLVNQIIRVGISINEKNHYDHTPLHIAVMTNNPLMVSNTFEFRSSN